MCSCTFCPAVNIFLYEDNHGYYCKNRYIAVFQQETTTANTPFRGGNATYLISIQTQSEILMLNTYHDVRCFSFSLFLSKIIRIQQNLHRLVQMLTVSGSSSRFSVSFLLTARLSNNRSAMALRKQTLTNGKEAAVAQVMLVNLHSPYIVSAKSIQL